MASAMLMNYLNGAKVLMKQVFSKHNSLEGKLKHCNFFPALTVCKDKHIFKKIQVTKIKQ